MNKLQACTEKQVMTVKEIAQAMGVSTDTVKNCILELCRIKCKTAKQRF